MKILALTSGEPTLASTHFRLGQFIPSLAAAGTTLTLIPAKKFTAWHTLPTYDLVILQKRLMRSSWLKKLRSLTRTLIFDTDDAIWHPHGPPHSWFTQLRTHLRLRKILSLADACTVPNEHLAAHLRPLTRRVATIPMALDWGNITPPAHSPSAPLRIGWAGAPVNLPYLTALEPVLREILTRHPTTELHIYCGTSPTWQAPLPFTQHPFSPGTEQAIVATFHIGLLPLPDNPFAAGKSPIKALQYAACAIPCIASPIGATQEIVRHQQTGLTATTPAEWLSALHLLITDPTARHRLGTAAHQHFLSHHTRTQAQNQMLTLWREISSQR